MSMPTPIANPANSVFARDIGGTPFHLISTAGMNRTLVKAAPGTVMNITAINGTATLGWLHICDSATAPAADGSTPVAQCYGVPASTIGNGLTISVPINFEHGIALSFTGGSADNDTSNGPAGVAINIVYR